MSSNAAFKALAYPTRREILGILRRGEMTACALAERFDMTKPFLSHHFAVLKEADPITSRRDGQQIWYGLNTTVVQDLMAWTMDLLKEGKSLERETVMTRKLLMFELLLIAASIIATVLVYPHLPDRVATHWGWNGQANGFSPKGALWLFGPRFLAVIVALTAVIPWLSPQRFGVEDFVATYRFIMMSLSLMLAYIYGFDAVRAHEAQVGYCEGDHGTVCLFVAARGKVMSKVRRNFYCWLANALGSER